MPKHHFCLGDLVAPKWDKERKQIGLIVGINNLIFRYKSRTEFDVLIDDKVFSYCENEIKHVGPMQSAPAHGKINLPRSQKMSVPNSKSLISWSNPPCPPECLNFDNLRGISADTVTVSRGFDHPDEAYHKWCKWAIDFTFEGGIDAWVEVGHWSEDLSGWCEIEGKLEFYYADDIIFMRKDEWEQLNKEWKAEQSASLTHNPFAELLKSLN